MYICILKVQPKVLTMNKFRVVKVGIFVVITIAIAIWGINYLKGKSIFNKENTYYVVYDNVNGLSVSNEVMIKGYKVGQVTDIKYVQDTVAKFVISFMVDDKYKIRKGSIAEVFSKDFMGTRAIRILQTTSSVYMQGGDTLRSKVEGTLVEQVNMEIAPLKRKAESLMSSLDSAVVVVRSIFNAKTQENLRRTFASLMITASNMRSASSTIDSILSNEDEKLSQILSNVNSITENLKNNNEKITNIVGNFSSISDSLAKADIAATIYKADSALLQFNTILASINEGNGTVAQLLKNDTLYRNLENASYHLSRLMRDMHENPKRYVHFSLFDVGKTVYISEEKSKKTKKKKKNKN